MFSGLTRQHLSAPTELLAEPPESYLSTPQLDAPSLLAPRHSLIAQLDATLFTRRGAQVGLTTAPAAAAAHTVRSMTLRT